MAVQDEALRRVLSGITAERVKALMIELARVPSPLTELDEAEPRLTRFIDTAVEPRLRSHGISVDRNHLTRRVRQPEYRKIPPVRFKSAGNIID